MKYQEKFGQLQKMIQNRGILSDALTGHFGKLDVWYRNFLLVDCVSKIQARHNIGGKTIANFLSNNARREAIISPGRAGAPQPKNARCLGLAETLSIKRKLCVQSSGMHFFKVFFLQMPILRIGVALVVALEFAVRSHYFLRRGGVPNGRDIASDNDIPAPELRHHYDDVSTLREVASPI